MIKNLILLVEIVNMYWKFKLFAFLAILLMGCESGSQHSNGKNDVSTNFEGCSIKANLDDKEWKGQCHTLHANHIGNQLIIGYDCTGTTNRVKGLMFSLNDFDGKGTYTFSDTTDGKISLVDSKYRSYILTYALDDSLVITKYSANHLKANFKLRLVNAIDRSDTIYIEKGKINIHEEKGNCTINRML